MDDPSGIAENSLLELLTEAARCLLRPLELQPVLDQLLGLIHSPRFGYPACSVLLTDPQTGKLRVWAHRGQDPGLAAGRGLGTGRGGIVSFAADSRASCYTPDVKADTRYVERDARVRTEMAIPLSVDGGIIGVLVLGSAKVDAFSPGVRRVLVAVAVLAALAVFRAQQHEEIRRQADTDGLTGLANHRAAWNALRRELARGERYQFPVSILILEVDRFKRVNDQYGHLLGDRALCAVAGVLKESSRGMDLPARVGGDEFLLILPQAGKTGATQAAERVRDRVASLRLSGDVQFTASLGVATFPEDGLTADALFEAADQAMYRVKRSGGDRVEAAAGTQPPATP